MGWKRTELDFLRNNYSKNIPLEKIEKAIKKTVKAIRRKAERENLHRPRFPFNRPSRAIPKKIIDRKYYERHKEKVYTKKMMRRRRIKEELVMALGGGCKLCGYNKSPAALEFHHRKKNKEGCITELINNSSKKKSLKEARKCLLLCSNCHRELHFKGAVVQ